MPGEYDNILPGHVTQPDDDPQAVGEYDDILPGFSSGEAGAAQPETPDLVAEAQSETGDLGDLALGGLDGLLLNYGDELGGIGQDIANKLGRDENAVYADDGGPVVDYDAAKQTTLGKMGNVAGNVATGAGIGLATGGLGGIVTQGAIGAGTGALAGYGQDHDPVDALLGGATGGLMGAGGRAVAGRMAAPMPAKAGELAPWSIGAAADDGFLSKAGEFLAGGAAKMLGAGPLSGTAGKLIGKFMQPGAAGMKAVPRDPASIAKLMGGVGAASGLARSGTSNASAQAVARPDVPTLTWAMQSVNAGGETGLPQGAQARLDEALMSGDDTRVSSIYMQYSLKYPAFQRRMQAELEAVNGGN